MTSRRRLSSVSGQPCGGAVGLCRRLRTRPLGRKPACSGGQPAQAQAEFIGLALFSPRGSRILRDTYHRLTRSLNQHPFHEAPRLEQASLVDLVQELLDQGLPVTAVDIYKGWMEVDTYEDYVKVCEQTRL